MKKHYILLLAICIMSIANAQQKNQKLPQSVNENINKISDNHKSDYLKSTNPNASKAVIWNFDTIIAFNTSDQVQKITQTFDNYGNILMYKIEDWLNNTWINYSKNTYTYDASGNMLSEIIEYWQNNTWQNNYRYTYTYDANGNMLTVLIESWQNNAWVSNSKGTYTYDANGNRLNWLHEKWQTNAWENSDKNTYTYDTNGSKLTSLYELWQNNAWVNRNKFTYTYDPNGNSITGKYEIWQNSNWQLSFTPNFSNLEVYSAENVFTSLIAARYEAHFVSFVNGIKESDIKPIYIYPNPASNNLTINLSQLKNLKNTTVSIYDIHGKLLLHQNIQQPLTELTITQFAKGFYIVKVNNNKEILVSKFVKE